MGFLNYDQSDGDGENYIRTTKWRFIMLLFIMLFAFE